MLNEITESFGMKNEKSNQDRTADSIADLEQITRDAALRADCSTKINLPCHINIHSIRKRLADVDGISGKAAIDGIVHAGILADDTAEQVESVSFTQAKGKQEETIITLSWNETK